MNVDGHAKCHFFGTDIFTNKKYEDIKPSSHNAYVPIIERIDYVLLDLNDDGYCSLLHDDGSTRQDIALPSIPLEMSADIKAAFAAEENVVVTVLTAMEHTQIVAFKLDPK